MLGTAVTSQAGSTVAFRGPNTFAGYLVQGENGELRADGKVLAGWLDTGDLGSVDTNGFIRLAGRAKDLIIRGGHNIDPTTIEHALPEHPDVTSPRLSVRWHVGDAGAPLGGRPPGLSGALAVRLAVETDQLTATDRTVPRAPRPRAPTTRTGG